MGKSEKVYGFNLKVIDLAKEYELVKALQKNSMKQNKPANSPAKTSDTAVSPRKKTGKSRNINKDAWDALPYPMKYYKNGTPRSPRKRRRDVDEDRVYVFSE